MPKVTDPVTTNAETQQDQQAGNPPSQEAVDSLAAKQTESAEKNDPRFDETQGQDQTTSFQQVVKPSELDKSATDGALTVNNTLVYRVKKDFTINNGQENGIRDFSPGQIISKDDAKFLGNYLADRTASGYIETVNKDAI